MSTIDILHKHDPKKFEQSASVEYMIFHTLEETPFYRNLARWPLHITIVPPFELRRPDAEIVLGRMLWESTDDHRRFLVTPTSGCHFGPNGEKPATKIADHVGKLQALHEQLIWDIGALGCDKMDGSYTLSKYQPHVTNIDGLELSGEPIPIDSVSLMRKSRGTKQLIARVGLLK